MECNVKEYQFKKKNTLLLHIYKSVSSTTIVLFLNDNVYYKCVTFGVHFFAEKRVFGLKLCLHSTVPKDYNYH